MTSSVREASPRAAAVRCTEDELIVTLVDGRSVSVPIVRFPRLAGAAPEERQDYELLGDGEGIHWPGIDEDISVAGLPAGKSASEMTRSA